MSRWLAAPLDQELAAARLCAAHQACPYSHATRDKIDLPIVLS
ncbi:hypothetical protein [Streptomyces sp. MS2.AVA.5]|uniref:Uncharacterized protein n=1 Tax=Streptomyces achmelvichensis TaxID=3134111 RepID=A0ACC6PVQ6_9ACTN